MSYEAEIGSPLPSTVNFPQVDENTGPTNAILFDDDGIKYKEDVKKLNYFDYAYGILNKDLPIPHTGGEVDWPVNWQSITLGNYGLITQKDSATITLQPGYKYKLTAWLTGAITGYNYWGINYQWYNNTTKGWVGLPAITKININEASTSINPAIAWVIMSGPGSTAPEDLVLKVSYVDSEGIPSVISAGSKFMIEARP